MLSDDNYPAISDVKANGEYIACLVAIARPRNQPKVDDPRSNDPRSITLQALAAGIQIVVLSRPPHTQRGGRYSPKLVAPSSTV